MHELTLKIPRKEARQLLKQQIKKGILLEQRVVETREELVKYKRDRLRDTKYNINMLNRIFGKDVEAFWRYEISRPEGTDFDEQLEFYKKLDGEQVNELQGVEESLDLIPDAPKNTSQSNTTPETTVINKWSRADKIALISLVLTLLGVVAAWVVVPEFRQFVKGVISSKSTTPTPDAEPDASPSPKENFVLERDFESKGGANSSRFTFHVIANSQDDTIKVEISKKQTNKKFQTITTNVHVSNFPKMGIDENFLIAEDMDFDGYEDFRILRYYDTGGSSYECYIFNTAYEKFELNNNLNEIIELSDAVEFDQKAKELRRINGCGSFDKGITRVFGVENGNYVLRRTYVLEDNKDILVDNETTCDSYYYMR